MFHKTVAAVIGLKPTYKWTCLSLQTMIDKQNQEWTWSFAMISSFDPLQIYKLVSDIEMNVQETHTLWG